MLQCGVAVLTIHKGRDGALIVGVGEEDQFFVDKFSKGHMVDPLSVQKGLGWGDKNNIQVFKQR